MNTSAASIPSDSPPAEKGEDAGVRSGSASPVVLARGLTKVFRDFWMRPRARAVDAVDFEINRGEIFGLLGPNGSGKSTTIKMTLGLLKKTSGRLAVFGKPPTDVSIKERIGYLPEESYLYRFLNARETLDYYAKLFRLSDRVRRKRIEELLEMVGLTAVQHRPVGEYSKGMQRRIGLAQALINDPEFLILDEPTTGLDPIGTRQVKDLIVELGRRGKTILLSSHQLSDVEDVVDRMVVLYGGKIRASGTCDTLLAETSRSVIETEALDEETIAELTAVLERRAKRLDRVSPARQRLEDLFVQLVEQARRDRLSNAGAAHGGATAAFLRREAEAASAGGGELIERLIGGRRADGGEEEGEEMPTEAGAEAAREDEGAAVIGGLMGGDGEEGEGEGRREAGGDVGEADAAPAGPDADMISSLLGGEGGEGGEGDEGGEGSEAGDGDEKRGDERR